VSVLSLYAVVGVMLIELAAGALFSMVTEDCADGPLCVPSLGVAITVQSSPFVVSVEGITLLVYAVVSPF